MEGLMKIEKCAATRAVTGFGLCILGVFVAGVFYAQEPAAPKFKFDPDWPKPLPNKMGLSAGIRKSAILRGFLDLLKSDVFGVGCGHALCFE